MLDAAVRAPARPAVPRCATEARVTRSLLGYGLLAGPVYTSVVLAQAALRPGFDLTRHDASLLSNGPFGWVQVANFLVTGAMVIACAVGVGRALGSSRAGAWAARLLAGYGLGLVGAGVFVADPMAGFPPGAPAGRPTTLSVHGLLHVASASLGFLCLVVACCLIARLFAARGRRGWARFSWATGIAFLAAFAGVASGSSSSLVVLGFWAGLILAWAWLAGLALHLYRRLGTSARAAS